MYEKFYGFRERPFTLLPDPGFLFLGGQHSIAYSMLEYGILHGSLITVITGEIGSGKTTLIRHLLNQLNDGELTVGLISNTHRALGELMTWVCLAYGLDRKGKDKADLYEMFVNFMIENFRQGKRTVLIIDEAQNMDIETLEELRVITNINADKDQLLQLVLVGQPELRETLRRPELEQLSQRVAVDYHIHPLAQDETDAYICHRLKTVGGSAEAIARDARTEIYHHSGGIPRLINKLCDLALVYGYATEQKSISAQLVQELIRDKLRNSDGKLIDRSVDTAANRLNQP